MYTKPLSQKQKFNLMWNFLRPNGEAIRTLGVEKSGYDNYLSAIKSHLLTHAFDKSRHTFNYAKAVVSLGTLAQPQGATALCHANGLSIIWSDNGTEAAANPRDLLALVIYSPLFGYTFFSIGEAYRGSGFTQITFTGIEGIGPCHAYMAFLSEDGKQVSTSVYLGPFEF